MLPEYQQCSVEDCTRRRSAKGLCERHRYASRVQRVVTKEISYQVAHANVARAKGKASTHMCTCGAIAQHWTYSGDAAYDYSDDIEDYVARCMSCHFSMDSLTRRRLALGL